MVELSEIPCRVVFEDDVVFRRGDSLRVLEKRVGFVPDDPVDPEFGVEVVVLRLLNPDGTESLSVLDGDETVRVAAATHERHRRTWLSQELERFRAELEIADLSSSR